MHGVMETRLHRAERNAELVGDLRQAEPEVVVEDDNRPLLGREPPEATFELIAIDDRDGGVRHRRSVDRKDPNGGRPAAATPDLAVTRVDEEPVQPRVEPLGIAKSRQLAPRQHERLLDGILGRAEIAQDPERDREEPIAACTCQAGERFLIPGAGSLDESDVHPRLPLQASDLGAYGR